MVIETKAYKKNQTTILDDTVIWNENGERVVTFRKKISLKDMKGVGHITAQTNALELEKELYQ